MRKRNDAHRMLESLEARRLLAGNVTAALDGSGVLVIKGDNKANDIVIVAGLSSTSVSGAPGTTVNGSTAAASFGGFPNFTVDTGSGDDTVTMLDIFDQSATVKTGNGNDTVTTDDVSFGNSFGTLDINTGNGDDTVNVTDTHVLGTLTINTGNGADKVVFSGVVVLEVLGTYDGGHGPDTFDGSGLTAGSSFALFIPNVETIILI